MSVDLEHTGGAWPPTISVSGGVMIVAVRGDPGGFVHVAEPGVLVVETRNAAAAYRWKAVCVQHDTWVGELIAGTYREDT